MESKKPLVSMILGIASVVCSCWGPGLPLAIAAIVVGNIAEKEGWGDNKSKLGKILGIVGIVISVIAYIGWCIVGFMSGMAESMSSY